MRYGAETIGHRLKKSAYPRAGWAAGGEGLVMDLPTITRAHELAAVYGVGLEQDENNLHCPLCIENK